MQKIISNRSSRWLCALVLLTALQVKGTGAKLYLATDKENYAPGELIQFQLFFLNTPGANTTLYVELLDCKANQLSKKMVPLMSGISWGNLEIPQAGEATFYILYCYLLNENKVESDCSKKLFIHRDVAPDQQKTAKGPVIDVFAEGGTIVSELQNLLLVSIKDEQGRPMASKGRITDSKNALVSRFNTDESGYAKIIFNPENKVRYVLIAEDKHGREIKKDLPLAAEYGINLSVTIHKDSLAYTVYSYNVGDGQLDYKLDVISHGNIIYKADINFEAGLSVVKEVMPLNMLAEGFLTFRLSGKNSKISAQRIVYNDHRSAAELQLRIVDNISKKVAHVTIPGYVNGFAYLNILGGGDSIGQRQQVNTQRLDDHIAEPVIINLPGNNISFNDHLVKIERSTLLQTAESVNANPFLTLTGTVYNKENKLVKNSKINLVFLHRNLKKEYQVVSTDRNGNFEINSLIFYDTVTVHYQLADNTDEKNDIRVDLKVKPDLSFTGKPLQAIDCWCSPGSTIPDAPASSENRGNVTSSTTLPGEKTLKEVTVRGTKEKAKTNSEKFIEEHVSAQHSQSNFIRDEIDFIAKPAVIDNTPIFEYLRGKMTSLIINIFSGDRIMISNTRGDGIGVYLDDMEVTHDLGAVGNLRVSDIALVRYYTLPLKPRLTQTKTKYSGFFGSGGSGGGGDLMIYTKKGFQSTGQTVKGLPKAIIVGYDNEKILVMKTASPAHAHSLYWKTNWTPKKEEIIYINLPTGATQQNTQLVIEGVNTFHEPFSFVKNLVFN